MIDRCFNPACKSSLEYLRDGHVVRVIRVKDENISVEHYWPFGQCLMDHHNVIPCALKQPCVIGANDGQ
jgi:hypothetical protein